MKIIFETKKEIIVRLDYGEEMVFQLKKLSKEKKIFSAIFFGLGAGKEVELLWYDLTFKKYQKRIFQRNLEIVNLFGNISKKGKEIIIHAHGAFSTRDFRLIGGHINKLIIGATCELYLKKLEKSLKRSYSKEIGLNLFQ